MKLHKDGTLEGTPQEIAEYNRLMEAHEIEKQLELQKVLTEIENGKERI
jgi:hypothetical protein